MAWLAIVVAIGSLGICVWVIVQDVRLAKRIRELERYYGTRR